MIAANSYLLQFMYANGGPAFALFGFAFHQFYYLYSSAAFAWCMLEDMWKRRK
jgi:hypothetical protein